MNTESNNLTGHATVDKPWERFYEGIEQTSRFLDTTPYIGLVQNNEDYPDEIAIEYFGAKISFGELIRNTDSVAMALVKYGIKKEHLLLIQEMN